MVVMNDTWIDLAYGPCRRRLETSYLNLLLQLKKWHTAEKLINISEHKNIHFIYIYD